MLFCCDLRPRLYQRYMCEGTRHVLDIECAQTHFTELRPLLSPQVLLKLVLLAPSSHYYMEREAAERKEEMEKGERKFIR